jgi:hypothetical protein
MSWVVFFAALALGWVLLWALGWSIDLAADADWPAHAMTRDPCDDAHVALFLLGVALAVSAAAGFIARGIQRRGWWQIGLWAGFVLIADALLMVQYVRLLPNPPCNLD